ncbi:hypothetical protein TNCV_1342081 [Trichonephila clavipes]|uniref:Reverse transcriptase/retrotransposon-derived protein RNase H-like domain-containing protein n=1 Tax=Trichonephila clavipes TaxID=2585209 RepID=A0A8X6VBJ2_TRICX|nr:hypothetical protein TNCV_1342081 [Trichonephila clavipes]
MNDSRSNTRRGLINVDNPCCLDGYFERDKVDTLSSPKARADTTLLRHPISRAKLRFWINISDNAVGGSFMQLRQNDSKPIAFLSEKLSKSQQKWSTCNKELQQCEMFPSHARLR